MLKPGLWLPKDCSKDRWGRGRDWSGRLVNISTENVLIENNTLTAGHGVALGSETSGWIRDVIVRDMRLSGVEAVVRIKSMRGRGGGVERVSYERISGDVEEVLQVTVMMTMIMATSCLSASGLVSSQPLLMQRLCLAAFADKPRVQARTQDQRERDAGRA